MFAAILIATALFFHSCQEAYPATVAIPLGSNATLSVQVADCPACPPCPDCPPPSIVISNVPGPIQFVDRWFTNTVVFTNCPPAATNTPPPIVTNTPPPVVTNGPPGTMTIPADHGKRIWWTDRRLADAKANFATASFTPGSSDIDSAEGQRINPALHYVLTGNAASARMAINQALGATISQAQLDAVASDAARYYGEAVAVTIDWCWNQMTASERATLINRWNSYNNILLAKSWGGPGFEGNNYYWAYLRNAILFAIATWGDNPSAPTILEKALARYDTSFKPWALGDGAGGVMQEGVGYGAAQAWYPCIAFETCRLLGRNLWAETPFWRDAVRAIVHQTTPGKSVNGGFELFPSNVMDNGQRNSLYNRVYYRDFMEIAASGAFDVPGDSVASIAASWIVKVNGMRSRLVSLTFGNSPAVSVNPASLDYFAPGSGWFVCRSDWGTNAYAIAFQLRAPKNVGHEHRDTGSFQLIKGATWISREATGDDGMTVIGDNGSSVGSGSPEAHSSLLIGTRGQMAGTESRGENRGSLVTGQKAGRGRVLFTASTADGCACSVDVTDVYKSATTPLFNNPFFTRAVRTFTWTRATGVLRIDDTIVAPSATTATQLLISETATPRFNTSIARTRVVNIGLGHRSEFDRAVAPGTNTFSLTLTPTPQ